MVSNVSKDIQSRIDSERSTREQLMKEATDLPRQSRRWRLKYMMKMMGGVEGSPK
jgi:hypothetical protein